MKLCNQSHSFRAFFWSANQKFIRFFCILIFAIFTSSLAITTKASAADSNTDKPLSLNYLKPVMTDVFVKGHGYPDFRIPSIIVSQKGTLLAFAEGRQNLNDHAENDIVLKRSFDKGKTWGKLQVVASNGKNYLNNPQAVVWPVTGRILLMYQLSDQFHHARPMGRKVRLCPPGISGPYVQKTFIIYSDNNGQTWSKPKDITAEVKRKKTITSIASGPGIGIVLQHGKYQGRIIMPTNESWFEGKNRFFNVYACYSDDDGNTWHYGKPAPNQPDKPGQEGYGNEVQMVELPDGSIMLNSRSYAGAHCRKVAISKDGGITWSNLVDDPHLPEPQCMGSIIRYSWPGPESKNQILFSSPGTKRGRFRGTIRLSYDNGKTWPVARVLYKGKFAYSCLTVLPDGTIGCLFERDGYKKITFARFTLTWLTNDRDKHSTLANKEEKTLICTKTVPVPKGWKLTFDDEFNTREPDLSKWNLNDPHGKERNQELQAYVEDAFDEHDGYMYITARKRPAMYDGKLREYCSGMMTTYGKFAQRYGRFEIRCRVPSGKGLWPAFWLLPQPFTWPPEIDIFEILGHQTDRAYFTCHWRDKQGKCLSEGGSARGINFANGFHTFTLDWTAGHLIWYVDGKEKVRKTTNIPNTKMFMLVNLAVGGTWPGAPDSKTVFPCSLQIDYVRVYARKQHSR